MMNIKNLCLFAIVATSINLNAQFSGGGSGSSELDRYIQFNPSNQRIESSKAIGTTLNSLFLGDQHKISSGGENVFFTNLTSDINFFPVWSGLKDQSIEANRDSTGLILPSGRVYGPYYNLLLGGNTQAGSLPYDGFNTFPVNISGLGISTVTAEDLPNTIRLDYRIHIGTKLIYSQQLENNTGYSIGDTINWWFDHPVEVRTGTTIRASVTKVDKTTDLDIGKLYVNQGIDATTGLLRYQTTVHNRVFEDKNLAFSATGADITTDTLINRIIVNEFSDFYPIQSGKLYFIDGIIYAGEYDSIVIPSGGIYIGGYGFDLSGIVDTFDNKTLFSSSASGNILFDDFSIETSGANSKVYDIIGDNGTETIELTKVKYNNCTSLGVIDGFGHGLEVNTGRYGGSPSLTLKGAWSGGFKITTSIARNMSNTTTEPLFKAGTGFVMQSRFFTDINAYLGLLQPLLDFQSSNFPNPSTLQLKGCLITRNGVSITVDGNTTPNISHSDIASDWSENQGMRNTFVGGAVKVTSEEQTNINAGSTWYDLEGIFEVSSLQHFTGNTDGELTHIGNSPREFNLTASLIVEGVANNQLSVRFQKWDSGTSQFFNLDYTEQRRQVNSLVGTRDVAIFYININVVLDKNDFVKMQVKNNNGNGNVTLESSSFYILSGRE